MNVLTYIKSDLSRITTPSFLGFLNTYFIPKGEVFRYIVWFRIMQAIKRNMISKYILGIPVYLIHRYYEYKYGIHVNTNIEVGEGLLIKHGDGVYLNCKKIGKNFTVLQGVTLGTGKGGIPTVEDNVTVYTHAVVVGDVVLHSGCTVGANSFVNRDVGENKTVVGIPTREIMK